MATVKRCDICGAEEHTMTGVIFDDPVKMGNCYEVCESCRDEIQKKIDSMIQLNVILDMKP